MRPNSHYAEEATLNDSQRLTLLPQAERIVAEAQREAEIYYTARDTGDLLLEVAGAQSEPMIKSKPVSLELTMRRSLPHRAHRQVTDFFDAAAMGEGATATTAGPGKKGRRSLCRGVSGRGSLLPATAAGHRRSTSTADADTASTAPAAASASGAGASAAPARPIPLVAWGDSTLASDDSISASSCQSRSRGRARRQRRPTSPGGAVRTRRSA